MRATTASAYQLLHEGTVALSEVEAHGLMVDTEYLDSAIADTERRIKRLEEKLRASRVYSIWRREFGKGANLDSAPQLAKILYEVMGFDKHGTGTDEEALSRVDHPFVRRYLKRKKLTKARTTYLLGIRREVVDGWLHPVFNLHLARTYRSTCDSPNFQNMPIRNPEMGELIRRAFIAPEGFHIVEMDYAAIEVRVAACYNKDPVLMDYICDKSKDMHRDMASECYACEPSEVSKSMRYCGKNMFVFPEFYGSFYAQCAPNLWDAISRMSLTLEGSGTPLAEHLASKGIRKLGACEFNEQPKRGTFEKHIQEVEYRFWKKRFRVYDRWKKKWWETYLERGWFDLYTGFRISGLYKRNDVINYPVQGAAFHCLLRSLILLVRLLRRRKMRSRVVGQIHDSIVAYVHESELPEYLAMAKEIMTQTIPKEWKWLIVPLEVEAEVAPLGATWHDKAKVDL